MSDSNIKMVAPPEGVVGEGFFATKLNDVVGMARANSLWPLPFATSCCGIEFMARWVIALGACASSGGIFDTYSVLQGIDKVIPVDVYVPGCPPRPEQIVDGVMKLQELVRTESVRRRSSPEYQELLASYNIK